MAYVVVEPQFNEWLQHPVTKAFKKALFNDLEYLKDVLLIGTEDDAGLRGRAASITAILRLDYEGLMESLKEVK